MEFPALVTISYGGYSGISSTSPLIIDSWTRVTSYLCIIHVDDGFSKAFKNGLEDAVKSNDAKKVQEQEMMLRTSIYPWLRTTTAAMKREALVNVTVRKFRF